MPRFLDTEFEHFLLEVYKRSRPDEDQVDQLRIAFYAGSVFTLDRRDIAAQLMQEHYDFIREARAELEAARESHDSRA